MEIKGKLIQLLALQTGEGKNGTWKKQECIIEIPGQYPKKVCVAFWGDKYNESLLKVGNELIVSFDVESREFNGKWYTELRAWKVDSAGQAASAGQSQSSAMNNPPQTGIPDDFLMPTSNDSDMPF